MIGYIVRRCLYAVPILIGINVAVFALFFLINTPDDMARAHLGVKRSTAGQIDSWKRQRNLHLPMFYNRGWTRTATVDVDEGDQTHTETLTLKPGRHRLIAEGREEQTFRIQLRNEANGRKVPLTLPQIRGGESTDFSLDGQDPIELKLELRAPAGTRLLVESHRELSFARAVTDTIFYKRSIGMLLFDFGRNDRGEMIGREIADRILPTLVITVPALIFGTFVYIIAAMLLATFRGTYIDRWGGLICVVMMSISMMFYIIGGQWLFGAVLRLVPVSGFDADGYAMRFWILPVAIIIMTDFGATSRFYRTVFLEELHRDHIRTARAKGTPESAVLFIHTLKNAMIPILTGLAVQIPRLLLGSLLIEKFFSIPGMGAYMVDAIQAQDFATVQAVVFLGSFVYVIGLLLTDLSYTLVDPRVRLDS
ncbi:MAG: ABC transporter permease subunit [Phycisphaeraceae bacterium]|nr:ABC transporter permease subunit [Phycisphaeraceae bacterium]